MGGRSRPTSSESVPLSVHNEGRDPVDVEVVVHGDSVAVHSTNLGVAETVSLSAPAGAPVEVHTPDGTATSMATRGTFFVVRDGRVLVAPV